MRKLMAVILAALLCGLSLSAWAAEEAAATAPAAAQTEAADSAKNILTDPIEKITVEEMQRRLASEQGDILYLNSDEEVFVYCGITKDKGLRKRIAAAAPNGTLLRLYTNNKDTFRQMYKRLQSYQGGSSVLGKYKVITDRELDKTLENGVTVYRFWFMKVQKEQTRTIGIPIGIGIGWGGHYHHGPWFGLGPWW